MGDTRLFHVESKLFELKKNAMEVTIIERGKKHRSIVSMGFVAAFWFRDSLLEVATLSRDQNAFRSFREGNKVYVVQKQRNDKGNFVTVTILGDSKGRGGVIILEGRDCWGWRGISVEIGELLSSKAMANHGGNHRRQPIAGKSTTQGNFRKEYCTFKTAVIQGNNIPKILPIQAGVDKIPEEINAKGEVVLNLKVILTCDKDGSWQASWAGLADTSAISVPSGLSKGSNSALVHNPKPGPNMDPHTRLEPGQGNKGNKVWKPKQAGPKPTLVMKSIHQPHGSGLEATRVPETLVSNRFSVFQVGESSGTCEASTDDVAPPPASPPAECTTTSTPLADAALPESDGKLILPVICPLSKTTEVDRT